MRTSDVAEGQHSAALAAAYRERELRVHFSGSRFRAHLRARRRIDIDAHVAADTVRFDVLLEQVSRYFSFHRAPDETQPFRQPYKKIDTEIVQKDIIGIEGAPGRS